MSNCIRCRFCFRTTRRMSNEAWLAALKVHGTRSLFLSLTNRREICIPAYLRTYSIQTRRSVSPFVANLPRPLFFFLTAYLLFSSILSFLSLSLSLLCVFPRFANILDNLRDPSFGNLEINVLFLFVQRDIVNVLLNFSIQKCPTSTERVDLSTFFIDVRARVCNYSRFPFESRLRQLGQLR